MSDGKVFESEILVSAKHIKAWNWSSNSKVPPCDRILCIPILVGGMILGLSCVIECKECKQGHAFRLDRIEKNQRRILEYHELAGGLSVVLLKEVSVRPRAFGMHWADWIDLENGLGYDPDHTKATGRRKAGTASFSLRDGERPPTMLELARVERPHGLGKCWDITPILPLGVTLA